MSALPPKAAAERTSVDVAKVPESELSGHRDEGGRSYTKGQCCPTEFLASLFLETAGARGTDRPLAIKFASERVSVAPLEVAIDRTWKPGDVEPVRRAERILKGEQIMRPLKSSIVATALASSFAMAPNMAQAQQVRISTTAAEVPGPAAGTAMTTSYVQSVGRMAYLFSGWMTSVSSGILLKRTGRKASAI
jgi:hypothetical protein